LTEPRLRIDAWLSFAVLLFLLQTLPYLSHRWVLDESWYAAPAYSIAHGNGIKNPAFGSNELESRIDARPPGTAMVIAAAFRLFGTSQIPARLGSVLAGVAIIFFTYCLTRNFLGQEAAVIAALLVATDNLIVLTSRTARPEALTTMAILASLLAMKRYAGKRQMAWALLSGLLIAIGTMFHITLLGYIVSFAILAIVVDYQRGGFPLRGAIAYTLGYALGLLPFAAWIVTAPLGFAGIRQEYLRKAVKIPLWLKFLQEGIRYSDLLGFNLLHGHGLESVPVRLPIPLCFLAASFLLWKLRPRWFYLELLLLAPSVLWLIYTVNKSSRYLVILAPVFALAIAAAVAAAVPYRRLHRVVLCLACLIVAAQASANLLLLRSARHADYNQVAAQLRSVIPPDQPVYGSMTFWLALHDHPYISDERTDPWMAANLFHTRYFILGDRNHASAVQGLHSRAPANSVTDEAFFADLDQRLAGIAARAVLVARFPDPYYGDLKVYKLP
jgi:4-amino-4-deoxy-L-arabinose transferase-like glycosyltransferase